MLRYLKTYDALKIIYYNFSSVLDRFNNNNGYRIYVGLFTGENLLVS